MGGGDKALKTSEPSPSPLRVDAKSLDLGEVWEDSAYAVTLPVTNSSGEDVRVTHFSTSCTCFAVEPESFVLPAGATREVRLRLDLTYGRPKDESESTRDYIVTVAPRMENVPPRDSHVWKICARVRSPGRFSASEVDFGSRSDLGSPFPARTVTLTAVAQVRILELASASPALKCTLVRSAEDESRYQLTVTAPVKQSRGKLDTEVMVRAVTQDGKRLPPRRIAVHSEVVPDVRASPPVMLFGAKPVGDAAEDTFTLASVVGRPFEVRGVEGAGEGLTVEALSPKAPATSADFRVRVRVVREGAADQMVRVRVSQAGAGEREVAVAVRYQGLRAEAKGDKR